MPSLLRCSSNIHCRGCAFFFLRRMLKFAFSLFPYYFLFYTNEIFQDLYGAKYPDWIDNPLLDGYDSERLKKEILAFTEKHQIRCTEYEPCRNMMSGVWLHNIITTLEKAQRQENTAKLIVFVSVRYMFICCNKLRRNCAIITQSPFFESFSYEIKLRVESDEVRVGKRENG